MEKLGRYELLRPIASGGMAKVYLGRANSVGGFERLVAIKLMHAHLADDDDFVSMFLDEARLAAQIRHPNVVGVSDVDRSDEGMFLVMDFVDGAPLSRILQLQRGRGDALPTDVLLRIFLDAMAGLHAAHELQQGGEPLNLVHRDISPANILVGLDGLARITDFGVARAEARIATTRGGEIKGKMPYMSPEHIMGENVDRRADVYSAACVLWEMFTLKRLFKADKGVIGAVLKGPESSPAEAAPFDIPQALDEVTMLGLLPQDQRPVTAEAFADLVRKASQKDGVSIADNRRVAQHLTMLGIESAETLLPPRSRDSVSSARPSLASAEPTEASPFDATQRAEAAVSTETTLATSTADELPAAPPTRGRQILVAAATIGLGGLLAYSVGNPPSPANSAPPVVLSASPTMEATEQSTGNQQPATAAGAPSASASASTNMAGQKPEKAAKTAPRRQRPGKATRTNRKTAPKPVARTAPDKEKTAPKTKPAQQPPRPRQPDPVPRTSDQFRPDAP